MLTESYLISLVTRMPYPSNLYADELLHYQLLL